MGLRKIATTTTALAAVVALAVIAIVAVAPAGAQDDSASGGEHTLKIGWAQNPHTLNPFVGLDEESYTVWAMNWDLPDDEAVTVAGLLIHEARRIPEAGQSFHFHHHRFAVLERKVNRVTRLQIWPPDQARDDD